MTSLIKNSKNKNVSRSGSNSPNWNGGRKKSSNKRYWLIWKPDHPFANCSGYIFEHRLIVEHYLKILFDEDVYLPSNIDIHHINGNTLDNRIQNLEPLYHGQHMILEHIIDMSDRYCLLCNSNYSRNRNWYNYDNGLICIKCYGYLYRQTKH